MKWIGLAQPELAILKAALAAYAPDSSDDAVRALIEKLDDPRAHPDITVGVYGGLVQWTLGNPFPIRICDYDGDDQELPDVDARGQRCSMWFESPDPLSKTT